MQFTVHSYVPLATSSEVAQLKQSESGVIINKQSQ